MTSHDDLPSETSNWTQSATNPALTEKTLAELRAPFAPEQVGKRPTITCRACRNSPSKVCPDHAKIRCGTCGQYVTTSHIHLDYVGHADVTDRLLDVDPHWSWEPLAYDTNGLPAFDEHGGLWAKLTICGKSMICYGAAQNGKSGPDAVKEIIGDMIRNGAMRFGVGLSLWGGKFDIADGVELSPDEPTLSAPAGVTQLRRIRRLWGELGYVGDANAETRLRLTSHTVARDVSDESDLTCEEAAMLTSTLERQIAERGKTKKKVDQ